MPHCAIDLGTACVGFKTRFLKHHPQLREQYRKTLLLLQADPHHPSLRLHALSGNLVDLHSVSINLSYRITLELIIRNKQIVPVNVDDHDTVYLA